MEDLGINNNNEGMLLFNDQALTGITDQDCLNAIKSVNYSNYIAKLKTNTCEGVLSVAEDGKYIMPFLCNHDKVLEGKASIEINCSIAFYKDGYIIAGKFDSNDNDGSETSRSWRSNTIREDLGNLCGLYSNGRVSGETSITHHYVETKIVDNSHRNLYKSNKFWRNRL